MLVRADVVLLSFDFHRDCCKIAALGSHTQIQLCRIAEFQVEAFEKEWIAYMSDFNMHLLIRYYIIWGLVYGKGLL